MTWCIVSINKPEKPLMCEFRMLPENKLIVKDNSLIDASFNLSLVEQRLMLLAIVTAREVNKLTPETAIEISAKEGTNLEVLLDEIEENLPYTMKKCEYLIQYDRSDMVSFLHRNGRVFEEDYRENSTFMIVEVDDESYNKSSEFVIKLINQ